MSQSIKSDRISESSIARIAGNIFSGVAHSVWQHMFREQRIAGEASSDEREAATWAVKMARLIADEVQRSAPGEAQTP